MQMAATRVAFVAGRQDGGGRGGYRKPTWKWSLSPMASFASQLLKLAAKHLGLAARRAANTPPKLAE